MQPDPILEWQRLTAHYRQMSDGELLALADDFADLTETAQQVLRSEFRAEAWAIRRLRIERRKPGERRTKRVCFSPRRATLRKIPILCSRAQLLRSEPARLNRFRNPAHAKRRRWPARVHMEDGVVRVRNPAEARQLCETLRQAGIESWIEMTYPRVLVAADQLDRARAIAANPIPQEIADRFKSEVPEYEPPACPKCGASDPVLEAVDPENAWRCEQCGEQWTETAASEDEEA